MWLLHEMRMSVGSEGKKEGGMEKEGGGSEENEGRLRKERGRVRKMRDGGCEERRRGEGESEIDARKMRKKMGE